MSNSVEAKIMVPVEPGPADEITHGNSDTEGLPTVKAESIQSDEMTPNDGQDAIITTRSDAVAEVKKMTQKVRKPMKHLKSSHLGFPNFVLHKISYR